MVGCMCVDGITNTPLNPFIDQVSKHMKTWSDACVRDRITNTPLNPFKDQVSKHMKPWSDACVWMVLQTLH